MIVRRRLFKSAPFYFWNSKNNNFQVLYDGMMYYNNRQYSYTPSFQAYEKTFMMLKPDSFSRNLDQTIMKKLSDKKLNVLQEWEGIAPREKLEANYRQHKNKSFFAEWIDFLSSGKVRALLVGGEDAVSEINSLKKAIRDEFAPGEKRFNLVHSSDDTASAKREIANFFDIEV